MTESQRTLLLQAANIVEEGWCQRRYETECDGITQRCASRALDRAACLSSSPRFLEDFKVAMDVVKTALLGQGYMTIEAWNDDCATKKDDVVSLFRSLASKRG